MNQLLLISHEGYASGARQATELILGPQSNLHVLELDGQKGIEKFKEELTEKIITLNTKKEKIVILSDLKNGSPYNITMEIIAKENLWDNVTLLSGTNLNLILEIVMVADDVITPAILDEIMKTACDGIHHLQRSSLITNIDDGDE